MSFIISNYIYSSDNQMACKDATTVLAWSWIFYKIAWKSMEMAWNFKLAQVYEPCVWLVSVMFGSKDFDSKIKPSQQLQI